MPSFKTALKIYLRTDSARQVMMALGVILSIFMVVLSFRLQSLATSGRDYSFTGLEEALLENSASSKYSILAQAENGAPVQAGACDANAEYCEKNLLSDGSFENKVCTAKDGGCEPTYNQQDTSILTPLDSHVWWVEDHRYQRPEVVPGIPGMTGSGLCQEELTSHGQSYLKMFSRQNRALNGGICFKLESPQAGLVAGYDVRITQNAFYEPNGVVVPVSVRVGFTSLPFDQVTNENQVSWGNEVTIAPNQYGGYQGRFASTSVHASSVGTVSAVCIQAKSTADADGIDTFWDGGFVSTAGGKCDTPNSINDGINRGCGGVSCDFQTGIGKVDDKKYSLVDYPENWDASSCDTKSFSNGSKLGNGSLAAGLEFKQCGDATNNIDCGNAANWVAGHYATGCVKDVGLLNYLSATNDPDKKILRGTESNPYLTQCLLNAYRSITADSNDTADPNVPLTLNFTKKFAGLGHVTMTGGKEQLLAVPDLGTAAFCGSISFDNFDSEFIIDPLGLDIVDESGNKLYGALGNKPSEQGTFLAKLVNRFSGLLDKPRITENEQPLAGVCTGVSGGEGATRLNTSDTAFFGFADSGGTCEHIVEEEIFEFTPEQLCDAQFTSGAEDEVVGATCSLSNSQFSFSGNKDFTAAGQGWALLRQDGVCIQKPVICGKQWECNDTQETIYNHCRAAQGRVTAISGDPHLRWQQKETVSDLQLSGLFQSLYNAWLTESSLLSPYAIYHENVATASSYVASVYDRQHKLGATDFKAPAKVAPYNTTDPFTGASGDDRDKPGSEVDIEQVKANLATKTGGQGQFLKDYAKVDVKEYGEYYQGGLALASFDGELTEGGGASQARLEFYYPYLGQIPRIMERVSFYLTNNRDTDTEIGAEQSTDSNLQGITLPFCDEISESDRDGNNDCFVKPCALYTTAEERKACNEKPRTVENKNCDPLADFLISQGFDSAPLRAASCSDEETNQCSYDKFGVNLLTGPGPVHGDDYRRLAELGLKWKLEVSVGADGGSSSAVVESINDFDGISVVRLCNAGTDTVQDQSCEFRTDLTGSPEASGQKAADFANAIAGKTGKPFVFAPLNEQNSEIWAGRNPTEVNQFYRGLLSKLDTENPNIILASPTYNVTFANAYTNFEALVDQFEYKDEIDIWTINIYNHPGISFSIEEQLTKSKEVFSKYNNKQIGINETGDFSHDMSRLLDSMTVVGDDPAVRYALLFNAFDSAFQAEWKVLVLTDDEIKAALSQSAVCTSGGNTGGMCKSESGILGALKIATDAVNSVSPRIIPEVVYAIGLNENLARTLTGDPNELAQTGITKGNDWNKDGKIEPICTKAYATDDELRNVGKCEYDVRGAMQFMNFTFYSIITSESTKDAMRVCTEMLGVDYDIGRGDDIGLNMMFEANGQDPASNDFSRYRVGDSICAAALHIANVAKSANNGEYIEPDEWNAAALEYRTRDITNLVFKVARYYVGSANNENCFGYDYCDNVALWTQDHINKKTFTGITYQCSDGVKKPVYTGTCNEIVAQIGKEPPYNATSALSATKIRYSDLMNPFTCDMISWTAENPIMNCSSAVSEGGGSVEKDCATCPDRATARFRHELHHGFVSRYFGDNYNLNEFAADVASANGGFYQFQRTGSSDWFFATEIVDWMETELLIPNGLTRDTLNRYVYADPIAKDELLEQGIDMSKIILARRTYAVHNQIPPGLDCGETGGGGGGGNTDTDWEIIAQTDGMTQYEKDDTTIVKLDKSKFAPTLVSMEQNPQNLQYHIGQGREAVINGGYFEQDFSTTGFLKINNSFIGDAGVFPDENGPGVFAFNNNSAAIIRTEDLSQIMYSNVLESNPLLVWKSNVYTSNVTDLRAKSAVGIDATGNYYLIVNPNDSAATGALTYKQLAEDLKASGLNITNVVSLDGGTSAGIAINDSGYTMQIKGTRLIPNVIAFDRTSGGGQITPPVGSTQTSVCGVVTDLNGTSLSASEKEAYNAIMNSLSTAIANCSSIESARGMKICSELQSININGCNDQSTLEPNVDKNGSKMQLVILSDKLLSSNSPYVGMQSQLGSYFATTTEEGVTYNNGKVVTYPNTLIVSLDNIANTAPAFKSESYLAKLWVHEFAHIIQGRNIFQSSTQDYLYKYHMEANGQGPDHSVIGRFFEACSDEGLATTSKYKANTRMANLKASANGVNISNTEIYQACKGDIDKVQDIMNDVDDFETIFSPY